MVHPEVLRRRLQKIDEYVEYLERAQNYSLEELDDDLERQAAVERMLQLSIEALVDMGAHVITDEGLGTYERSRDVPGILNDHGYLGSDLCETWEQMIGLRDILVHQYLEVDIERLYDILQEELDDIQRIADIFNQFL